MEFSKFSNALNSQTNEDDIEEDINYKEDNQNDDEKNDVFAESISIYNNI